MTQTKLKIYKSIRKKNRKKLANSILNISVKDQLGKIYKCDIPVKYPKLRKTGITTRERTIFFPVSADEQNWEITNFKGRRLRISELKNQAVVLHKGTKKISGTVVDVVMASGGATSPPVGGTLPPVDE